MPVTREYGILWKYHSHKNVKNHGKAFFFLKTDCSLKNPSFLNMSMGKEFEDLRQPRL